MSNKIILGYFENWISDAGWGNISGGEIFALLSPYTHINYMPLLLKYAVSSEGSPPIPGNNEDNDPNQYDGFYFDNTPIMNLNNYTQIPQKSPDNSYYRQLSYLSKICKKLNKKISLTIGGWTDIQLTPKFSSDSNDKLANSMVNNILLLVKDFELDGIDFDWEHLSRYYYESLPNGRQPAIDVIVDRCLFLGRVIKLLRDKSKNLLIFYTTRPNTFFGPIDPNNEKNNTTNTSDREGIIVAAGICYDGKGNRSDYIQKYIPVKLGTKQLDTDFNWDTVFNTISYVNSMSYDARSGDYCDNTTQDKQCLSGVSVLPEKNSFQLKDIDLFISKTKEIIGIHINKFVWGIEPCWQAGSNPTTSLYELNFLDPIDSNKNSTEIHNILINNFDTTTLKGDTVTISTSIDNYLEQFIKITEDIGGYFFWAVNSVVNYDDVRSHNWDNLLSVNQATIAYLLAKKIGIKLSINTKNDCDTYPDPCRKFLLTGCSQNGSDVGTCKEPNNFDINAKINGCELGKQCCELWYQSLGRNQWNSGPACVNPKCTTTILESYTQSKKFSILFYVIWGAVFIVLILILVNLFLQRRNK